MKRISTNQHLVYQSSKRAVKGRGLAAPRRGAYQPLQPEFLRFCSPNTPPYGGAGFGSCRSRQDRNPAHEGGYNDCKSTSRRADSAMTHLVRALRSAFGQMEELARHAVWQPSADVYRTPDGWLVKLDLA